MRAILAEIPICPIRINRQDKTIIGVIDKASSIKKQVLIITDKVMSGKYSQKQTVL